MDRRHRARFLTGFHFVDPPGSKVTARLAGNLTTTSTIVMRTAAVAGMGLWLRPPYIVSDLLASGALVPLLPDYERPEMEIVALYPSPAAERQGADVPHHIGRSVRRRAALA